MKLFSHYEDKAIRSQKGLWKDAVGSKKQQIESNINDVQSELDLISSDPFVSKCKVTAQELRNAFNIGYKGAIDIAWKGIADGDAIYKGQRISIQGVVAGKNGNRTHMPNVRLGTVEPKGIKCIFSTDSRHIVNSVDSGDHIIIQGKVQGKLSDGNIVVTDCAIE